MSTHTKEKRAAKEAKRLPSVYVDPTKPKPRETLWRRYRETGLKYEPYEVDPKVIEAREKARLKYETERAAQIEAARAARETQPELPLENA